MKLQTKQFYLYTLLFSMIFLYSCEEDDAAPAEENEVEVITDIKLIFTNKADANDKVEAKAKDPDGEGTKELEVSDAISLKAATSYTLTFEIMNNLETPGEDIGEEVKEEGAEHQIFFSFTDDAFSDPAGNGNIDNASDKINYKDTDASGNPIGLITEWTTGSTAVANGEFVVRLQHQPDVKTSTSTATTGDTDFNLKFVLNIQ